MNPEKSTGRPAAGLQAMLRLIARYDPNIPSVIPDGVYGRETLTAVAAFQQRAGLPVTGVADAATWRAARAAYLRAAAELGPAEPLRPVWQSGQVIRIGERNGHMPLIRAMLDAVAARFPSLPAPGSGTLHDEASAEAVRWLQSRAGLPPTGEITRETWKFLVRLYRTAVGDGTDAEAAP